jgi:predicted AlkP superfamily phosphohydrolase/phosphomutase
MQERHSKKFDLEQIDIAPTIAKIMKIPFQSDGKPVEEIVTYGENCNQILLLIIDAFGYSHYMKSKSFFKNISKIHHEGRFYKCKANANKTTPAIASILCGRRSESHRIYSTEDVYKSHLKSILEVASEWGIKSAIIMEERGALTFKKRIDVIKLVKERENIIEFDDIAKEATIEAIKERCKLIVTHLRSLDKLGYTLRSIESIDENILEIIKAYRTNSLIMLFGDHPPHESKEFLVPLIVSKIL